MCVRGMLTATHIANVKLVSKLVLDFFFFQLVHCFHSLFFSARWEIARAYGHTIRSMI